MFTDKKIRSLKPKQFPYREFEKGADKGFGVQVSTASKTFFIQYRSPVTETKKFFKLGTYPETSLASARKRCQKARDLVNTGKDPSIERERETKEQKAAEEQAKRQAELERITGTVTQLFEAYIQKLKRDNKRSYKDVEQIFKKDIEPYIGSLKARDVTPEQVKDIISIVYRRGAKIVANQVRSFIMSAYSFGINADYDPATDTPAKFRIDSNPARDIPVPAKVTPGERNLSEEEIRELWNRLDNASMSHGKKTALKLLFATGGQRIEEVLGMEWDHLDFKRKLWELPSSSTKNNRSHVVPLSDLAISLLQSMEPFSNDIYVFPHRDNPNKPTPHRSLSQAVNRFFNQPENQVDNEKQLTKFIPKDIRRTVKSRMGEIGISKEIRDRLQNHALHDVSSKHYDRFDYLEPKKQAMETWTRWLESILNNNEPSSNIIELKGRK